MLVLLNSFAKKAHLNVHITTVHEEKKDFKSNVCDANFSPRIFLKNHFTSFIIWKKLNCDICDASFSSEAVFTVVIR